MTSNKLLTKASDLLEAWAEEIEQEPTWLKVRINAKDLVDAVKALYDARWGYLSSITGLDLGAEAGVFEVIYHFFRGGVGIGLYVRVPRGEPRIPTICGVLLSASLLERELQEMLGITVVGTPNPDRLFLPEDWPDGVYPLRQDFDISEWTRSPSESAGTTTSKETPKITQGKPRELDKGRFVIPIGPQHPALKEPGHFELIVDGEIVSEATVRLGYAHRGIEKAVEQRPWAEAMYMLERTCGICSHVHSMTYCRGVETLAGVEVPERAQAIRVLMAELERLHSHMLWFGVSAHDAGFETLFMYSWRDREIVMDLLERVSGNRVNYSSNVLGGVKFDISQRQIDIILEGVEALEKRVQRYLDLTMHDESFLLRTRGIGRMSKDQAEIEGTVGPTARASGVERDVRFNAPYSAYRVFSVQPILDTEGDLLARFVVRIRELFESIRLIREVATHLPEGPLTIRIPSRIPEGEIAIRSEAPRGELYYYLCSTGGKTPYRVKVRTPTLSNWGAVLPTVRGAQLADVPMILVGIDPCFSCNDRSVVISPGPGDPWTWERLCKYGIDWYADRSVKEERKDA